MTLTCTMILGDSLEVMPTLQNKYIQMCFADLPYALKRRSCGENTWDLPFPLAKMWQALHDTLASSWVTVFTATQPFASELVVSSAHHFRHEVIWLKRQHSSPFNAKIEPLRAHESCLIFGAGKRTYNPQMTQCTPYTATFTGNSKSPHFRGKRLVQNHLKSCTKIYNERFPMSYVTISGEKRSGRIVSAQKPVALLNWLIRTYSNPGDNVLDPVSGSGTTAVSAILNGRNVTCIEKNASYFDASVERAEKAIKDGNIDARLEVRRI